MRCNGKIIIDARSSKIDLKWLVAAALDGFPKEGCIYTQLFDVDNSYPSIWPTVGRATNETCLSRLIDGKKVKQLAPVSTLIDQAAVSYSDQKIVQELLLVFTLALSEDAMVTTSHESSSASISLLDGKLSVKLSKESLTILEEQYSQFLAIAY